MESVNPRESLLNETDIAERLRVSVGTVRRWRLLGTGPRFIKIGASVRYRAEDLREFLETRPTGGGEPQPETVSA